MTESPFLNSAIRRSYCDVEEEVTRRSPTLRYSGGTSLPLVSIGRRGLGKVWRRSCTPITECIVTSLRMAWGRGKKPGAYLRVGREGGYGTGTRRESEEPFLRRSALCEFSVGSNHPPSRSRKWPVIWMGWTGFSANRDKIPLSPDEERVVPNEILAEDAEKHGESCLHRLVFELTWSGWADLAS